MNACKTILLCYFILNKYVNRYKIYSYQLDTSTSFLYSFDPSAESHAFEVEVNKFITCLPDPTLEQITLSGNKVTPTSKVTMSTKIAYNLCIMYNWIKDSDHIPRPI